MSKRNLLVGLSYLLIILATAACAPASTPPPAVAQPPAGASSTGSVIVAAPPGARAFVIDPSQSEARFVINEVLNGSPNTVIGRTNKVQGQIFASFDNPSATTLGPVKVDLGGLVTDSGMRNRMIQGTILQTENPAFQFAEFDAAKLTGLPDKITLGQPFDFKITGNLTLHSVTKEVTFDAAVTPVSETQLKGKASLTIAYGDWGVQVIRLPPQVASVEDKTILEIEFVALAE